MASAGRQRSVICTFSLYTNLFSSPSFALIGLLPCSNKRFAMCDFRGPNNKQCYQTLASNTAALIDEQLYKPMTPEDCFQAPHRVLRAIILFI